MAGAPLNRTLLATLLATGAMLTACGDDAEDSPPAAAEEQATEPTALDPASVEASVEEFLANDEIASSLEASVDCGDEPAETVECSISGAKGLSGRVAAAPSQGFQYTGEVEGPDGLSSLGGSVPEGSVTDPASVEAGLNEALSDQGGAPSADCPDAPAGDTLACKVTGDEVSGTIEATPIGGFEWEGQIETSEGTRAISGNQLP